MEKLNINQWAEEDRPREKMASLGADALSNAELLAILIGSGSTKESAVELMKRLLADWHASWGKEGRWSLQRNVLISAQPLASTTTCIRCYRIWM